MIVNFHEIERGGHRAWLAWALVHMATQISERLVATEGLDINTAFERVVPDPTTINLTITYNGYDVDPVALFEAAGAATIPEYNRELPDALQEKIADAMQELSRISQAIERMIRRLNPYDTSEE